MLRELAKRCKPWQITVAAASILAAVGILVYLVEIGPRHRKYQERDERNAQFAELVGRSRGLDATLRQTRDAAAGMREFLATTKFSLEPRSRLNDRLTAICNLAGECGLVTDGIEPQRESAEAMFITVTLRLSGRGSYQNCVRFLHRLRKEMPYHTVAGIEISAPPSSAEPTAGFNFHLIWHAAPMSVAGN